MRERRYRGIVVDLRLFRMRSDRDAINNDALTDPMAGGRPHESHDLTFAWVARARSRASRESRSRCDFCARRRERSERAISSVTAIATTDAAGTSRAAYLRFLSPLSLPPSCPRLLYRLLSLIAFSLSATYRPLRIFSRTDARSMFRSVLRSVFSMFDERRGDRPRLSEHYTFFR